MSNELRFPRKNTMLLLLVSSGLALTACGNKKSSELPQGQVVAKLDGEDVTQLEINAELRNTTIPPNMTRRDAEKVALQNIIVRKMLAKAATERKLDQTPDYILLKRRADEQLRVQALANDVRSKVRVPTGDEVRNFIDQNRELFRERKVFQLDQIQFLRPEDPDDMKKLDLENLHTLGDIVQVLQANNIEFRRQPARMDVLTLTPAFLTQITDLLANKPNEPFVFANQVPNAPRPVVFVNQILEQNVVPFTGTQANEYAKNRLYAERVQTALRKEMENQTEKAKALTVYQAGWEPDEKHEADPDAITGGAPALDHMGDAPAKTSDNDAAAES